MTFAREAGEGTIEWAPEQAVKVEGEARQVAVKREKITKWQISM